MEPSTSKQTYQPYVPPPPEGPQFRVHSLKLSAPFRWLTLGLQDFLVQPATGLFYGVCFLLMLNALVMVFNHQPEYTMSIVSGCLLMGPFLAMGLYEGSRRREMNEKPSFIGSLTCWSGRVKSMGLLVLVLMVVELLWGRASLVVFAVFFDTGLASSLTVMEAVFNPQNWEFLMVYCCVGGFFAVVVFSVAVVSMPMILDKDIDAITAGLASVWVVYENTAVMLLWGGMITLLTALAILPWGIGLVLVGPLLGHASWHAYKSSIHWLSDQ